MNQSVNASLRRDPGSGTKTWEDEATGLVMQDAAYKRAGKGMSNPFTAEMSLLASLTSERVSSRKEGQQGLPPPVALVQEQGVTTRPRMRWRHALQWVGLTCCTMRRWSRSRNDCAPRHASPSGSARSVGDEPVYVRCHMCLA